MVKNHLKRLAVPRTWDIRKKKNKFIARPSSGGQVFEHSVPLIVLFRDMLKKAKTMKEMKYILHDKEILLNRKRLHDHRASVGLMDVISIPETRKSYRLWLNRKGKLTAVEIDDSEANLMLCKLRNKTVVKGGRIQLNFSNGRSMLVDKNDYSTGDVLLVEMDKMNVKEHLKLEKGAYVYLIGGRHTGATGKIEEIKDRKLVFKTDKNDVFETSRDYAFVIGKDSPLIKLAD
jgi:small subunit ribosomal protein S4e